MKEKILYLLLIIFSLGIGLLSFAKNRKELKDIDKKELDEPILGI